MKHSPIRRLWGYARQHRRTVWRATAYSILNKVFDLAPPALIGLAVDTAISPEKSVLHRHGLTTVSAQLWLIAALTILVWGLESLFEYAHKLRWRNLAQTLQHELRLDVYRQVQSLDASWFVRQKSGRLMSILNDDINQLERFLDSGANDLLQVGSTVLVVGAIFFWANSEIACLAILPIPLILWGSFLFQRKIAPRYAQVREDASQLNAALSNRLVGIDTIKSFTAEERELERIDQLSLRYQVANAAAIKLSSAFSPLIRMAILVGFVGTLVYGGFLARDGVLAVGTYSMLIFLTQRLLWPLTRLGATFDLYQRAMASADRALDLLDLRAVEPPGLPTIKTPIKGDVEFRNVAFNYPDRTPLFERFSVSIPAGTTVALVGPTGSGKTTLMRLLMAFYQPSGGQIFIDGQAISGLQSRSIREQIGLVSQSVYLFPGSVYDNILYGRPDATDAEVRQAANDAECLHFIDSLPNGFQTEIGERGIRLSGGQAQRLSIARCLLKDPPIVVFDEATSAIDNETERSIQRTFNRLRGTKTTLLIAHRLSTVRHAHHIMVLDNGSLVEAGHHEGLLAANGRYAHLWKLQSGELE